MTNKPYRDCLHLFVLVAFAVAQPLYDLLGKNPEFFVAHSAKPGMIIGMIFVLSLGFALVLAFAEFVLHAIHKRAQQVSHLFFVFVFTALILLPLLKKVLLPDLLIVGLSGLGGLLFAVFYARLQVVRLFLSVLLPATLIFPLWFVFGTPVNRLVLPQARQAHSEIQIKNPVPIIIVVFDEFSTTALLDAEERIDAVRFPNFAALASEALWFPNAITVSGSTVKAVTAILSGLTPKPDEKLMPTVTDYPNNLFTMLGGHYEIRASEVCTTLCPQELSVDTNGNTSHGKIFLFFSDLSIIYTHLIAPPGMMKKLPPLDAKWAGFLTDTPSQKSGVSQPVEIKYSRTHQKGEQLNRFLSQITSNKNPPLFFMHTLLPHVPYGYLASGQQYPSHYGLPDGIVTDKEGWLGEKPLIVTAYHRYLQQVGYVDRFLGMLKEKLISEGIYDDAMLVIMADHGVAFEPGQTRRRMTDVNKNEILKIPLFIKLPKQKQGRIDKRIVSSVDVLPTIIDVIKADVPWKLDGFPLASDQKEIRKGFDFVGLDKRFYLSKKDIVGFSRLQWQIAHFGEHTPLDGLVPKGPFHDELCGSEPANLQIGEAENMLLISQNIGHFQYIDTENHFLPSLLSGYIEGAKGHNLMLAVAINGKIRLTTHTSQWNEQDNFFSVLLPKAALQQGRNIVDIYLIEQKGKELLLYPLVIKNPLDVKLHRTSDGMDILIFADGKKVTVENNRDNMNGYLDWFFIEGGRLVLEGWAADMVKGLPASEIVMFKGEKLICHGETGYMRKDVAEAFNKPLLSSSGYYMSIPMKAFETAHGDISLIALSGNERAFQIHIKDEYKELFRQAIIE